MSTNPSKYQKSSYFMGLALQQAIRSLGNTKENPAVGCVIVKNNHLISAGYTSLNGRPHAEQNAINFSKINPRNSELYVTLEPCSHYGKTPPCVKSIIKSKIKKVFFSINDPDPRSFNKSSITLRREGVAVKDNILKDKIKSFYKSYFKFKKSDLPFVTCKLAISKDFYTINKKKKWITNEFSRGRVHLMRSLHECVVTSSKTIIKDDPRLTCRIEGLNHRSPSRIVLDNKLKIRINSKIIKEANIYRTIIFYNKINRKKIISLKRLRIKTYKIPLDNNGNLDLKESLIKAKKLGFSRIFVETGTKLTTNFLNKKLIDDFKLFISSRSLGKNGNGSIKKYFGSFLKNKKKIVEKVNLSGDKLISYKIK